MTHSYVNSVTRTGGATDYRGQHDSAEFQHLLMLNHFQERLSAERFKLSDKERAKLNTAIRSYPNKNHKPV